jgi:hypothetical protein
LAVTGPSGLVVVLGKWLSEAKWQTRQTNDYPHRQCPLKPQRPRHGSRLFPKAGNPAGAYTPTATELAECGRLAWEHDLERDRDYVYVNDLRGFQANLVLLVEQGHLENLEFSDDDETRQFVDDVRRRNRDWTPGKAVLVPPRRIRPVRLGPHRAPAPRRAATTSRARPTVRRTRGTRADQPPPLGQLRGFLPATVQMVRHLERRRAKAAAA